MVLISNKESFYNLTRCLFYCFVYIYKLHNRILITKKARTKLLENTLNESLKLKNISDERLGCLTKSLLSRTLFLPDNAWPFENSYFAPWKVEENFADSHGHNILRLFDVWPNFCFRHNPSKKWLLLINMVNTSCLMSFRTTDLWLRILGN